MTEAEWLACDDPTLMAAFLLHRGASDRKARLFYADCCRIAWKEDSLLPALRDQIEVAERWADRSASETEREWAEDWARSLLTGSPGWLLSWQQAANTSVRVRAERAEYGDLVTPEDLEEAERHERYCERVATLIAATLVSVELEHETGTLDLANRVATLCDGDSILRDIFGNPFRPFSVSPEWRTATALALASQMYDSRDFSAMPILADALQDAGCDDEDILEHCRSDGPHVRGCWVVDLVLGKN